MRTLVIAALIAAAPQHAFAAPFATSDPAKGEKLVAERKCEGCHIRLVGGDGSGIYTRPDRVIRTPEALLQRVGTCNAQTNAGFLPDEEEHVAAYLNRKYYKFK